MMYILICRINHYILFPMFRRNRLCHLWNISFCWNYRIFDGSETFKTQVYLYFSCYVFIEKKNKQTFIIHRNSIQIHKQYILFFRKAKLQITREVSRQHHPHNSALSADINISEPPLSSGAQEVKKIYSLYYS